MRAARSAARPSSESGPRRVRSPDLLRAAHRRRALSRAAAAMRALPSVVFGPGFSWRGCTLLAPVSRVTQHNHAPNIGVRFGGGYENAAAASMEFAKKKEGRKKTNDFKPLICATAPTIWSRQSLDFRGPEKNSERLGSVGFTGCLSRGHPCPGSRFARTPAHSRVHAQAVYANDARFGRTDATRGRGDALGVEVEVIVAGRFAPPPSIARHAAARCIAGGEVKERRTANKRQGRRVRNADASGEANSGKGGYNRSWRVAGPCPSDSPVPPSQLVSQTLFLPFDTLRVIASKSIETQHGE